MDEHLFYKINDRDVEYKHKDIIEVDIDGFKIHILKKGWKLTHENLDN
jgi:hypothetical protein